jgi:hypothetical protein
MPTTADRRPASPALRFGTRIGRGHVRTLPRNVAFSGSLVDPAVGLAIEAALATVVEPLVGDASPVTSSSTSRGRPIGHRTMSAGR